MYPAHPGPVRRRDADESKGPQVAVPFQSRSYRRPLNKTP